MPIGSGTGDQGGVQGSGCPRDHQVFPHFSLQGLDEDYDTFVVNKGDGKKRNTLTADALLTSMVEYEDMKKARRRRACQDKCDYPPTFKSTVRTVDL